MRFFWITLTITIVSASTRLLIESTRLKRGYAINAISVGIPHQVIATSGPLVIIAMHARMRAASDFMNLLRPIIKLFATLASDQMYGVPSKRSRQVKLAMRLFSERSELILCHIIEPHKALPNWGDVSLDFKNVCYKAVHEIKVLAEAMNGLAKHMTTSKVYAVRDALLQGFIFSVLEFATSQEQSVIESCEPRPVTRRWIEFTISFIQYEHNHTAYTSLTFSNLYKSLANVAAIFNRHCACSSWSACRLIFLEIFAFYAHEATLRQNMPNIKLKIAMNHFHGDGQLLAQGKMLRESANEAADMLNQATEDLSDRIERLWEGSVNRHISMSDISQGKARIEHLLRIKNEWLCKQMSLTMKIASACLSHL